MIAVEPQESTRSESLDRFTHLLFRRARNDARRIRVLYNLCLREIDRYPQADRPKHRARLDAAVSVYADNVDVLVVDLSNQLAEL